MGRAVKKRECPTHWVALEPRTLALPGRDVVADKCPKCEGLFFDRGEIRRVTGSESLNLLLTKHLGFDSDSRRVCPACGMVMDMEDCDGVRVDVCLSCFGVWLDHGELEALKAKPDKAFGTFTPEKVKELDRAKEVRARDRKKALKLFFYRLAGLDLIRRKRK